MIKIAEVKQKKLIEGIIGQYVHGATTTLGYVTLAKGSQLPLHHHPQEQLTYMLDGKLEMHIGDELVVLEPGTVKVIPSNTPHSAVALTDCKLIDVFSPVREDYKE